MLLEPGGKNRVGLPPAFEILIEVYEGTSWAYEIIMFDFEQLSQGLLGLKIKGAIFSNHVLCCPHWTIIVCKVN